MQCVLLADEPTAVETLTTWYYEQWGRNDGFTRDEVRRKVSGAMNRDRAPLLVLAKEGDELLGAAGLKIREMDLDPDYEFWLGSVYVAPRHRGRGIASVLVDDVISRAARGGIQRLYLQTEDLTGGLYLRHGFAPLQKVQPRGVPVLVMEAKIGS